MGSAYKADQRKNYILDSIASEKKIRDRKKLDSISLSKIGRKNNVSISDQVFVVKKRPALTKRLVFEWDGSMYRYKVSERNESFLSLRVELRSESKVNGREGKFFPEINVYSVNKDNELSYVSTMDYQLYANNNLNTVYLEQIYDFKEKETFVCWTTVTVPIKQRLLISVNNPENKEFNFKNVVGEVNP